MTCKDCIHYGICDPYVAPNESFPEVGGCKCFVSTADVVEVVRCKDCIHSRNMPLGLCYLHTEPYDNAKGYKGDAVCVEPNDYCSYGERKEDDDT